MNEVFAFLVGIERYDQPGWNLRGPCANAIGIAEWLLSIGVPGGHVVLFLAPADDHDYGPTIEALEDQGVVVRQQADFGTIDTFCRTELASQRPVDSRLLCFWSGHGFMEDDGTHVFICSDYTAGKLTNRVFNGSNFRRHLRRSSDFTCFSEQIVLADVCAVHTSLAFEPNRSSPQNLAPPAYQLTYFATPEGEYAKGDDGIGVFTRITTNVLKGFSAWPGLEEFTQAMDVAFQASSQKPFLVYEADGDHERAQHRVGAIAADSGNALFHSLWDLLSPIDLPNTAYRPHFLRTISTLGRPELAAAQGLSGMIRELTSFCDTSGAGQIPYGLLGFLIRLSAEPKLEDTVNTWLNEHAATQQNDLATIRQEIGLESEEKILIVEVRNDAKGKLTGFDPSLRNQDLKPVLDIRLPPSQVTSWNSFKTGFLSVVDTLRSDHDVWDFQIHFLVNPPLFDLPFHEIPINGSTLGEEFIVLVRYRDRLRRPSAADRRCWCQYADALRGNRPGEVQVLPIPDPGAGRVELDTDHKGLCYSHFVITPESESLPQKQTLTRLLRLGAAYLCWSHELPQDGDWSRVHDCLMECLGAIATLDQVPDALKRKRLGWNPIAQQATLLWDDPAFHPFPIPRGTQIR